MRVQNCSKGTKIVSLPRECQLSYAENSQDETFKTSPALLALIQQIPPSFWGLRLAVRLLEQRAMGETSPFNIYIRHLPSMVQSMPMFFSRAVLSVVLKTQLKGMHLSFQAYFQFVLFQYVIELCILVAGMFLHF
jgi:hypothetical protein